MNKTLISIIGIVVIGGLIAIIAIQSKNNTSDVQIPATMLEGTDTSDTSDEELAASSSPSSSDKKMSFADFVKQGDSYQCTVNQYIDSTYTSTTTGKVFIANENIRGNYTTNVQGMSIDTSVIVRDGFVYTWTSMAPMGYKAPVSEQAKSDTPTGTSGSFSWNADMIGDYDCQPWAVNASMFTVPANITFQTI